MSYPSDTVHNELTFGSGGRELNTAVDMPIEQRVATLEAKVDALGEQLDQALHELDTFVASRSGLSHLAEQLHRGA